MSRLSTKQRRAARRRHVRPVTVRFTERWDRAARTITRLPTRVMQHYVGETALAWEGVEVAPDGSLRIAGRRA